MASIRASWRPRASLALIRPDDPRVSDWLEEGLHRAEDLGDRTGQCNSLVLLAWHHTFRGYLGGRADVAVTEECADRALALAEDLGFTEFKVHSLCLGAMARRFTGRLHEAMELAERAAGVQLPPGSPVDELVKGVGFLAAAALDPGAPVPSLAPSNDPVAWVGWLTLVEALLLSGRIDEASALNERTSQLPGLGGAIDGMTRTFSRAFGLVMAGRHGEAGPLLRECLASARAVRAVPMTHVAHALLGEVQARAGDAGEAARSLDKAAAATPDGLAAAFALRGASPSATMQRHVTWPTPPLGWGRLGCFGRGVTAPPTAVWCWRTVPL